MFREEHCTSLFSMTLGRFVVHGPHQGFIPEAIEHFPMFLSSLGSHSRGSYMRAAAPSFWEVAPESPQMINNHVYGPFGH